MWQEEAKRTALNSTVPAGLEPQGKTWWKGERWVFSSGAKALMSSWESCSSLGSMKDKLELRLCVSVPLAHPPWVYGEGVADGATGHPLPTLVGLGGAWEAAGGGPMQGFGREAPLTRHITEQEQGVR